jgi:hypothetical protein
VWVYKSKANRNFEFCEGDGAVVSIVNCFPSKKKNLKVLREFAKNSILSSAPAKLQVKYLYVRGGFTGKTE